METDIHKALARMLENLAKLQSAREQVEQVSASGKELTEQTVVLLAETSRLISTLETNTRELSEQFAEKVKASEVRIDRVVEERNALIGSMLDDMKQVFAATETTVCQAVQDQRRSAEETLVQVTHEQQEHLNGFRTSLDERLGQTLTDFKSRLLQFEDSARKLVHENSVDIHTQVEVFRVSAQEIKGSSVAAVKEVSDLSIRVLNEHELEVKALMKQLKETDEGVRGLLGIIQELDLGAKWMSLDREMKTFGSEMKTFRQDMERRLSEADTRMETLRKGQTWLFYALGGIALLSLVLKFV